MTIIRRHVTPTICQIKTGIDLDGDLFNNQLIPTTPTTTTTTSDTNKDQEAHEIVKFGGKSSVSQCNSYHYINNKKVKEEEDILDQWSDKDGKVESDIVLIILLKEEVKLKRGGFESEAPSSPTNRCKDDDDEHAKRC